MFKIKYSVIEKLEIRTLIVADPTVTAFYKDDDVEAYLLSIMEMVKNIYSHSTIGFYLNLTVSGIILMAYKPEELNITLNADDYLKSFCQWQSFLFRNLTSPQNIIEPYNTAILITRLDLCAQNYTPCGTLGLAEVGAMCQVSRSCVIAEDTGLNTAFTIAHEIGHLLGMKHDNMDYCQHFNLNASSKLPYVMDSQLPQNLLAELLWSNCSYYDLSNFIYGKQAQCLKNIRLPESNTISKITNDNEQKNIILFKDFNMTLIEKVNELQGRQQLSVGHFIVYIDERVFHELNSLTNTNLSLQVRNLYFLIYDNLNVWPDNWQNKLLNILLNDTINTNLNQSLTYSLNITDKKMVFLFKYITILEYLPLNSKISDITSRLNIGTIFNIDRQCQISLGLSNVSYCPGIEDICNNLWCKVGSKCLSKMKVTEDGTLCGTNKWCLDKKCVDIFQTSTENVKGFKINGRWGPWLPWSKCSRSCGNGISISKRHCSNPSPQNGGQYCLGREKIYKVCNHNICNDSVDIRDLQCQDYGCNIMKKCESNWTFDKYSFSSHSICLLNCVSEKETRINLDKNSFINKLNDGSPCDFNKIYEKKEKYFFENNIETVPESGICINGICHPLACDNELNSNAIRDACGVCNGNNASCKLSAGNLFIDSDQNDSISKSNYKHLMTIPQSSTSIKISEFNKSQNFLAMSVAGNEFILNGNNTITWNGEHSMKGIFYNYYEEDKKEIIDIKGPLPTNLSIYILQIYNNANISEGITYTYYKPQKRVDINISKKYKWIRFDWSTCSKSCGMGVQFEIYSCADESGIMSNKILCRNLTKPKALKVPCNINTCPPYWWTGNWQPCVKTCGRDIIQKRSVFCVINEIKKLEIINDDVCEKHLSKPKMVRNCSLSLCL
ncbi:unnamed protein product [Gordionus sp. m RMFG-2023]